MRMKWLHLSDIHFNYKNYSSALLREDFIKQIESMGRSEPFTHLFLTGDILFRNQKARDDTARFIESLIQTMGIPRERVYLVPGNHDHDREQTIRLTRSLYKADRKKSVIDKTDELSEAQTRKLLAAFGNFFDVYRTVFAADYYSDYTQPHLVTRESDEVSIIRLNTAWLDQKSDVGSVLCCGSRQLQKLLSGSKELLSDRINIALGHHPLVDLREDERNRLLDIFVRNHIGIYFCGHRHKPSIDCYCDKKVIQITCPGAYNDGYSEGGYVWGILDTACDVYKAEIYSWGNGNWSIESKLAGTDERGILYFDTPSFRHNGEIAAVDIKLFDGHIPKTQLEQAIGCPVHDVHTFDWRESSNWEEKAESILRLSEDIKFLVAKGKQVHLFPIAPIPMLIKLGFELQNNFRLYIHQYDREQYRWLLDGQEDIRLTRTEQLSGAGVLAVRISASAKIEEKLIQNTLMGVRHDLVTFEADKPGLGRPLYAGTVATFAQQISEYLNAKASAYQQIHIFAAVPVGLAIEIGRRLLRSVVHNVYTYNLGDGRYECAYVLNPSPRRGTLEKSNVLHVEEYGQDVAFLPVIEDLSHGELVPAMHCPEGYWPVPAAILDFNPHVLICVRGSAMTGEGVEEGDYLLVRRQTTAERGKTVVARGENGLILKRNTGNPEHGTLDIHGVVIMVMKRI